MVQKSTRNIGLVVLTTALGGLTYYLTVRAIEEPPPPPPVIRSFAEQVLDHMPANRRSDAEKIIAQTLKVYDERNAADAPGYADGREAVRLFAGMVVGDDVHGEGVLQRAAAHADAAIKEGLQDPLVHACPDALFYYYNGSWTVEALQAHFARIDALLASDYPAPCFFPQIGAGLDDLRRFGLKKHPEMTDFVEEKREMLIQAGLDALRRAAADQLGDAYLQEQARWFANRFRRKRETYEPVVKRVDQVLVEAGAPDTVLAYFRGDALLSYVWQAGYEDKLGDPAVALERQQQIAEASALVEPVAKEHPKDARLACLMMSVEDYEGKGRPRMEKWFAKAIEADPKCYEAYFRKLNALADSEERITFGLECRDTGYWDAVIPMLLVESIVRSDNFGPQTSNSRWKLLHDTASTYLAKYPDSVKYRTQLMALARRAERWEVVREQSDILGDNWDRTFLTPKSYKEIQEALKAHEEPGT